jgi:7-cyano-7-deazaguanine reductase
MARPTDVEPREAVAARRAGLATRTNPNPGLDYVVSYEGALEVSRQFGRVAVELRYVPDRLVLEEQAFAGYLAALAGADGAGLEETAALLLDDLNNELVARWVHLRLSAEAGADGAIQVHQVALEDRQPGWDNPALLERLKPF